MTNTTTYQTARTLGTAAAALAIAALLTMYGDPMHALKAAGMVGKAPAGASGFKELVAAFSDNLEWVIVTCITLAVSIGGTLMLFGHSRAQDHLIRMGGGIVIILFVAPATLA